MGFALQARTAGFNLILYPNPTKCLELAMCFCSDLICYNTIDGTSFPLKCRSYICEEHGAHNRSILKYAVYNYIKDWPIIRFWTFTLSSKYFKDSGEHLMALSKIWRYFITQLRRSPMLSESESGCQFIRFSEPHVSGYFHFHCIFDRYVQWYKVYALWLSAIESVTGLDGKVGGCHVKGIYSAKNAAFYVVKYITKSARLKPRFSKLYTKSARVAFFPKTDTSGIWAIYNTRSGEWFWPLPDEPLLEFNIAQRHEVSTQICLFPGDLPPPHPFWDD